MLSSSWDKHYADDLANLSAQRHDGGGGDDDTVVPPSDLPSWFEDVGAPERVLDFLTSDTFPMSPNYNRSPQEGSPPPPPPSSVSVLDLGTGNGGFLLALRMEGHYAGPMVGVDYSPASVELARQLAGGYGGCGDIRFEVMDVMRDDATARDWWPAPATATATAAAGFDLVLDKGTFDAISLAPHQQSNRNRNRNRRPCQQFPARAARLVKPGGFFVITSCNWTEAEVVAWFTTDDNDDGDGDDDDDDSVAGKFEVWGTVPYPRFRFGGHEGQGVATVAFRRRGEEEERTGGGEGGGRERH